MKDSPKQKTFSRTSQYLQPIYKKVAKLKQNLYEQNSKDANDDIGFKFTQNIQSHGAKLSDTNITGNNIIKRSLSLVKLNNQNNLNRQDAILKQRKLSQEFMRKKNFSTTLKFTTIAENQMIDKDKFSLTVRSKSTNNISFGLTKYSKKSSNLQITKAQNSQKKKYFTTVKVNSGDKVSQNKQKIQKNDKSQPITGRKQNKMIKIIGFLDRNQTSRKKQFQSQYQNNQNQEELIEMTDSYIKNFPILPKVLDSDQNIDQNNAAYMLKQEKQDLDDQIMCFKPIGSAKTLRKNIKKVNTQNQQQEATDKIKQKNSLAVVVQSKLSNYSNQSKKVKYLQKGNRFRQTLYKKLLKGSEVESGQMIYVNEYKQWVPSKLLESNKKELDTYMSLLLGEKKSQKTKKMTLENIDIMYF